MTSLPISLPTGYTPLVKKGDEVKPGQPLARNLAKEEASSATSLTGNEVVMDLSIALASNPTSVRQYLKKAPGDSLSIDEVVAEKQPGLGLKKQLVLSGVSGTVVRFERDTGRLYIRTDDMPSATTPLHDKSEILSPLAGKVTLCNNEQIVLETESKALQGTLGFGGTATAEILVLSPEKDQTTISGVQITKDAIDKILLLPDMATEAVVKADAIGVAGILGTELSEAVISFIDSRKLSMPVIAIDSIIGKKLLKVKHPVTIHGEEKTVLLEE